jgi:ATP/ADP translocase
MSSAAGGMAVSGLTKKLKLSGTLACTGLALLSSIVATEKAYSIAEANGFSPEHAPHKSKKPKGKGIMKAAEKKEEKAGMVDSARKLFKRVPVLRALFFEILASQGLATLLNVCFVQSLGKSIPDDTERAGWVGNFYALINLISMSLQFGVLPLLMQVIEPKDLWRSIPIISLACITFQSLQHDPSLYVVSLSLLAMKVLEYSARRMLDEMVYVPLDFESRFVGKEVIGVFGYRFGKSLMSLSLSGLTSAFGNFSLRQLSMFCQLAGLGWAKTAWDLSALVPTQKEAQDSYISSHKK